MAKKDTPPDTVAPKLGNQMPRWVIPVAILAVVGAFAIAMLFQGGDEFTMNATVVASFKHAETKAYTQGLEFYKGFLIESTGYTGESDWRIVNLATGEVCYRYGISSQMFGEGITVLNDQLFQITWRDNKCFVYDLAPLGLDKLDPKTVTKSDFDGKRARKHRKPLTYKGEGWGLTNDGTHIIMSSGHANGVIRFRDTDFKVVKEITVTDGSDDPVGKLNEIEYVDGTIYANVFETDTILKIDASSGKVLEKIDASGLLPEGTNLAPGHVLNGIARDPATGKFYVTGKNWPSLFEVKFETR